MADEIYDKIVTMIAEEFGIDGTCIARETDLREGLGVDSLDALQLIMEAEDEWDIAIADEEAEACQTVGDVEALIRRKVES